MYNKQTSHLTEETVETLYVEAFSALLAVDRYHAGGGSDPIFIVTQKCDRVVSSLDILERVLESNPITVVVDYDTILGVQRTNAPVAGTGCALGVRT